MFICYLAWCQRLRTHSKKRLEYHIRIHLISIRETSLFRNILLDYSGYTWAKIEGFDTNDFNYSLIESYKDYYAIKEWC